MVDRLVAKKSSSTISLSPKTLDPPYQIAVERNSRCSADCMDTDEDLSEGWLTLEGVSEGSFLPCSKCTQRCRISPLFRMKMTVFKIPFDTPNTMLRPTNKGLSLILGTDTQATLSSQHSDSATGYNHTFS